MDYRETIEHAGLPIGVTDHWLFHVEELKQHFSSLREAKEAIDGHFRAQAAEKRAEINKTLRLPVLLPKGGDATITGVNARTGSLNGVNDSSYVYPPLPWLRQALKAKAELQARIEQIDNQTRGCALYLGRIGGYGRITPERYDGVVENVRKEYAETLAKAEKVPVPAEWAEPVKENA